jgi:hypothetical protein
MGQTNQVKTKTRAMRMRKFTAPCDSTGAAKTKAEMRVNGQANVAMRSLTASAIHSIAMT